MVFFFFSSQLTAAGAGKRNAISSAPCEPGSTDPSSGPSRSTLTSTTSTANRTACRRAKLDQYPRTAPETRPNHPSVSEPIPIHTSAVAPTTMLFRWEGGLSPIKGTYLYLPTISADFSFTCTSHCITRILLNINVHIIVIYDIKYNKLSL